MFGKNFSGIYFGFGYRLIFFVTLWLRSFSRNVIISGAGTALLRFFMTNYKTYLWTILTLSLAAYIDSYYLKNFLEAYTKIASD